MDKKYTDGIRKGAGRALLHLLWPWSAIRRNIASVSEQKAKHAENIVYIRELLRRSRKPPRDREDGAPSFEEAIRDRDPDAPGLADLERRFLRQKRLALGTCACFVAVAGYALANGNILGIATLLSCLPLFFMACLSAQLRLWQLRTRRLSKSEGGGLRDFMREIKGWYWQVIDPEFGKRDGEKS